MSEKAKADDLPKEDPRYYVIQAHGDGSASIATSEKHGKVIVHFGLPSMTSLFLSMAHKAWLQATLITDADLFVATDQGPRADDHTPLFNLFELQTSNVVFSFSALESFANQSVPMDYNYTQSRSDQRCAEVYNKEQVERFLNLDTKLDKVLPDIFKVSTPKGASLWNKYKKLKDLRDRIIHLKSNDTKSSGSEIETSWGSLLNSKSHNYALDSYEIIKYYLAKHHSPRWLRKFPYDAL